MFPARQRLHKFRIIPILVLFILNFQQAGGQRTGGPPDESRLQVGISGGINSTFPTVLGAYNIFGSTNADAENSWVKDYYPFYKSLGHQYQFMIQWRVSDRLFLLVRPGFSQIKYGYSNRYTWVSSSNPDHSFSLVYQHAYFTRYLDVPIQIKYHFSSTYPTLYIFGGGQYSHRQNVLKEVVSQEELSNSVGVYTVNTDSETGDVTGFVKPSQFAVTAGGGYAYEFGSLVVFGEVFFQYGIRNITNESARYSNENLLGSSYDAIDDLRLNNLGINIGILFSLNKKKSNAGLFCK